MPRRRPPVPAGTLLDHTQSASWSALQWWRDAINDCYKGKPPAQPVVTALAAVLAQRPLTRYRLQQIVSAREEDLLAAEQPGGAQGGDWQRSGSWRAGGGGGGRAGGTCLVPAVLPFSFPSKHPPPHFPLQAALRR